MFMTTKAALTVTVYQTGCDSVYCVRVKAVITVTVHQRGCDCVYDNKSCAHRHCVSERM